MKALFFRLFSIGIIIFSFFSSYSQTASDLFKQGKKALAANQTDDAIEYFGRAIQLKPSNTNYIATRAEQYEKKNKINEAIADYRAISEINPKDKTVYIKVADLYVRQEKYNDAILYLKKLLMLDDRNTEALEKMSKCLLSIKDYAESIRVCEFGINNTKRKNVFYFYYHQGIAWDSLKDYLRACRKYDTALNIRTYYDNNKTSPYILKPFETNYGLALFKAGQNDESIVYYTNALEMDKNDSIFPKNYRVYYQRSFPYLAKSDFTNAISDLTHAVIANPADKEPVFQRGVVYQKTRQFLSAISDYTKFLQMDAWSSIGYSNRAACYAELENYKESILDYKKAFSITHLAEDSVALIMVQNKFYDNNKEKDAPELKIEYPILDKDDYLNVLENQYDMIIKGKVLDKSPIELIKFNSVEAKYNKEELNPEFICRIKITEDLRKIELIVSDVYHNALTKTIKVGHIISDAKLKVKFEGNITEDDDKKTPLANQEIVLVNKYDEVIKITKTNLFGGFKFENLPLDQNYYLKINAEDSPLNVNKKFVISNSKNEALLFSSPDGKNKFSFTILPTDVNVLGLMSLDDAPLLIDIKGKMIATDDSKTPLSNITVQLLNSKGEIVATKTTDGFGAFLFSKLIPSENYTIRTDEKETSQLMYGKIYLTDENGKIIKEITKNMKGIFDYQMIPTDKFQMAKISESDPWLRTLNLSKEKNQILIIENIFYPSGSAEILPEAEMVITKAIDALKNNPKLTLEVQSHTDAIAGDDFNKQLSQNRANNVVKYMIARGIEKNRLTAKGFGETQLTNHCGNGVECSDAEHQQNRRTVFKLNYSSK